MTASASGPVRHPLKRWKITVLANVASTVEARRALEAGAAGVGLLRTGWRSSHFKTLAH